MLSLSHCMKHGFISQPRSSWFCLVLSQFIKTIDRDTLFSFKIDSSPFNLPFHLINHDMTATNTHILPLTTLWWWTLLFALLEVVALGWISKDRPVTTVWGQIIGEVDFHCFFLTKLLTWNLKCKFSNQPSTFCQHVSQVLMFVYLWMCALLWERKLFIELSRAVGYADQPKHYKRWQNHHWRFSFQN